MKNNELVEPHISSPNKSFIVTLFYKFIYSKEERLWLDQFRELNLSREQKTVVKLGIDGRLISPREIFEHVGIVDTEKYRQLVESLAKLDLMERGGFQESHEDATARKSIHPKHPKET
jgi:ATP-dependent DNA helicase RecG